ncbi:MAG: DsrE family protein [Alphaproteobacteria bacterium]|uniref:DsrE family protein n=1 Tax=Candidatus Nitrobium versatile TaxID=2884831 RepID=A0A953M3E9_9BACT|nr:DsrE family protein [Candidatus Nitrobium versatile]
MCESAAGAKKDSESDQNTTSCNGHTPSVRIFSKCTSGRRPHIFTVLCTSGFDRVPNVHSALMLASLAASADYRAILFCQQGTVDVMVKGAIEKNEKPEPGAPTLSEKLAEAMELGVEVQCCAQTMMSKGITDADLVPGVTVAGAMTLIDLAVMGQGTLCF